MAETTDFFHVSPILSVGIVRRRQLAILPFYRVEIYHGLEVKRLFVNYTFGQDGEFESEIGGIKLGLFQSIRPVHNTLMIVVESGTTEQMAQSIRQVLYVAENETRIVFVWPRKFNDDKPFFRAMQLTEPPIGNLITLKSLGFSVEKPYVEKESF